MIEPAEKHDGARQDRPVRLVAIGDVQPNRPDPERLFELVRDHLSWADIRMCQLEATFSTRGTMRTDVRNPAHRVDPRNIGALTAAGINVVTFAGNNNLDYGIEAFADTIELCEESGIEVVGGGDNLAEAQRPRYMTVGASRIAFVNFCSILRDGYAAKPTQPGISPLRVSTFYEPLENIYEQPGTPARTVTVVNDHDLRTALAIIAAAKAEADVVVAAFHWGVHFTHDLAIYQPDVAYAAIDAGADVVIGTHPHCLQAVDVYQGKFIFYSLGNFAFEQPERVARHGVGEYLSFYGLPIDELPQHPHPYHCRKTMIVKLTIDGDAVVSASLVPTFFNDDAQPEPLDVASDLYEDIAGLIEELCAEIGTSIERVDGELRVEPVKRAEVDTRTWVRERGPSYPWLGRLIAGVESRASSVAAQ